MKLDQKIHFSRCVLGLELGLGWCFRVRVRVGVCLRIRVGVCLRVRVGVFLRVRVGVCWGVS